MTTAEQGSHDLVEPADAAKARGERHLGDRHRRLAPDHLHGFAQALPDDAGAVDVVPVGDAPERG